MSRLLAVRVLALGAPLLAACGYEPLAVAPRRIAVPGVAALAPYPELASCLTGELRRELSAHGARVERRGARLRLEGDLVDATAAPGGVVARGALLPSDQRVELAVRLRLVDREQGVVWGPTTYRVATRAALGPGPIHSGGAAGLRLEALCREVADRVVLDLATARLLGRSSAWHDGG